ncbi:FdxN element excision controlling factor protein [Candidatus Moduliflexus flocculans]|uniref:FdxN element excision controlling factor protein n=1 Tax=Candidatus Moduliflexus flocculans TaxID=1499966 RepID=A0A081BS27_9BACT|nr:FdxN element excision controlling factor protein [Candidatus Moduliflexus flocculans]
MDKLTTYRNDIRELLQRYQEFASSRDEVETQVITDAEHDHYQLVHVGWQDERRVYGCVFHIDIKDGKIWIQYNGTEWHLAEELVKSGVPKEDIVLGFHSPSRRKFTEYAVN